MYKKFIFFGFGLLTGCITTYLAVKEKFRRKYADLADSEIESMKNFYEKKSNKAKEDGIDFSKAVDDVTDICESSGYISQENVAVTDLNDIDEGEPFLIEPDSFGELDYYSLNTMTYYSDGVLLDDMTSEIMDVETYLGRDSLTHFGDPEMGYEEGVLYIRNVKFHMDIEVVMSPEMSINYLQSVR